MKYPSQNAIANRFDISRKKKISKDKHCYQRRIELLPGQLEKPMLWLDVFTYFVIEISAQTVQKIQIFYANFLYYGLETRSPLWKPYIEKFT